MTMGKRIYNGLTKNDVNTLWGTWKYHNGRDFQGWESVRDFVLWAAETGYIAGAKLRRYDEKEPYSPGNCYWEIMDACYPEGHPCRGCAEMQDCSTPCSDRLRYWDEGMERIRAGMEIEKAGEREHEHVT